jgi:serine/threonine protein kinase
MFDEKQQSYKDFRDIAREGTRSVIAWVGAGLSVPAGLPMWGGLRDRLCAALENKAASLSPDDKRSALERLDFARQEKNLWVAFGVLKKELGESSYRTTIRGALKAGESANIPGAYLALWKLRLAGMLNLNLDRLAARAHASVHGPTTLHEFSGKETGPNTHLLKSPYPFLVNLHGIADNASSWVFTHGELRYLMANQGYKNFISTCMSSKTVLFVGISADDVATGGHLARLAKHGIDPGPHYWITHRSDRETDTWAENAGIRIIRYQDTDGSHADLQDFFDKLLAYIPRDDMAPPVAPRVHAVAGVGLPEPRELGRIPDAEEIRQVLNREAALILSENTPDKYDKYAAFSKQYNQAIYRAWYVTTEPPDNVLLGYTLSEQVARGAFGTVYRAVDTDGNSVAVKVLHEQIRNNQEMLQSFRRGVRSMDILSKHGIAGMVPYRQTSEIPALVVMDFVEGPSLLEAVKNRAIKAWHIVITIAATLAKIIRESHNLPERVLHRDIRPSNIMLRNGWLPDDAEWEVVVLDFDLSWHREAQEMSVASPGMANGYLAPEQVQRVRNVSTRNAAVDCFGLGMTLFFLRTGVEPTFSQHRHRDWSTVLSQFADANPCREWRSVPKRYFRLVEYATQDAQAARWDMSQIEGELTRLKETLDRPETVQSAELLAEELAARGFPGSYQWNTDTLSASLTLPTGLGLSLTGKETASQVQLDLSWKRIGVEHHARVTKWLPTVFNESQAILRKSQWIITSAASSASEVSVTALIPVSVLRDRLDDAEKTIAAVVDKMQLR